MRHGHSFGGDWQRCLGAHETLSSLDMAVLGVTTDSLPIWWQQQQFNAV